MIADFVHPNTALQAIVVAHWVAVFVLGHRMSERKGEDRD